MLKKLFNSDLGYYIYTGLVIVAGLASLIFFYFMVTGFNIGVYAANTTAGSVYIGGLDESEAEQKIRNGISSWLEDDEVPYQIGYQGYYYTFDRELFTFDVDATMATIREGRTVPLQVNYSPGALNTVEFEILQEPFMENLQDVFDFEAVIEDVLTEAEMLRDFSRMELSNYFIDEALAFETLNEVVMPYPAGVNPSLLHAKLSEQFDGATYNLNAREVFSVQESFNETYTSSELNTLGSILLKLVTPTNMVIIQRHYNPQIDYNRYTVEDFPYYGYNVRVNRNVDYDFTFENINEQTYDIEFFEVDEETLGARLVGPPFLDTIKVDEAKTVFPLTTETTSNPDEVRPGKEGVAIILKRTITPIDGSPADTYDIVFEYYPPISAIELNN
jgi:hypothetical protein